MNSHVRTGAGKMSRKDGEDVGAGLVDVEQLLLLLLVTPLVTTHITVMHYSLQWDALKVFGRRLANGSIRFRPVCRCVFHSLTLKTDFLIEIYLDFLAFCRKCQKWKRSLLHQIQIY